ncbi:flavo protein [Fusarium oxysporum Fo47]|uniref:Flavin prenyltransferase PAD1, mitochondrial n=1 Tax=Fusarium oxysporum Fo47 TaxID=660027 RepID=W9K0Y9_FUSOX|nr:flavo protein [Fusarium oxysporum Fo47]EWZ36384.1 3-octaprenyl-4-hydroxybenzoate carboxy-lyase UbiX [Fusarium oxysporum Fo47]QKD53788.1 flavo protein [Fusarium oxysporum Fo47]
MRSFARPLRLFSGHDLPKLSMARHLPAQARYQSSSPGPNGRPKRIVVAVTGATGSPLAVALLQRLRELDVETHLVMSKWGGATLKYELEVPNNTTSYLESLASVTHSSLDVSASLSSGSFRTDGMIVVPCSMKTLAGIRMGYDNDLIVRAASVTLKERRRLVLVARETPLTSIYLENMLEVTKGGAVVFPPVMAFYTRPSSIDDMVQQSVMRMIDLLDLEVIDGDMQDEARWSGFDWAAKGRQNA